MNDHYYSNGAPSVKLKDDHGHGMCINIYRSRATNGKIYPVHLSKNYIVLIIHQMDPH